MLKPTNGHILIQPLVHEGFIATQKDTYEEIGIVIDISDDLIKLFNFSTTGGVNESNPFPVHYGDKVYFDSWLAAKYPKDENSFYWLVKWEDVRAIEPKDDQPK